MKYTDNGGTLPCICTMTHVHIHEYTHVIHTIQKFNSAISSRRRSMICDTVSRNRASLVTGSVESCASWTISSIIDSFFKVSLHIILPMAKGVSPLSTPFFRSMVDMRRVRAHSTGMSHP